MPGNLLAQRFRLLLEQLADELGGRDKHGIKTAIGRRLGLAQAHVTMLLEGDRNANWGTVTKARQKLPVKMEFFSDPELVNPQYRAFLERRSAAQTPVPVKNDRPVETVSGGHALTGLEMLSLLDELNTTKQEQADLGDLLPMQPTREVVEATLRGLRGASARRNAIDNAIDAMDDARGQESGRKQLKRKR